LDPNQLFALVQLKIKEFEENLNQTLLDGQELEEESLKNLTE
jgi:hypothetical protein